MAACRCHLGAPGTSLLAGLAVLGSAVLFALGAVWIDARLADVPPLAIATTAMCFSAIALLPFAASSATLPSPRTATMLLALGAVGTGAALVLFYALIQRISAARAAIAFYLAPGFAVLYGTTLLHDELTATILAGLGLITAGSLLTFATSPSTRHPDD